MASLDIILPAYNPLPGWERIVISRFQSLVIALPDLKLRLFIVNDGSDKTDLISAAAQIKAEIGDLQWVTYSQNRGKGYALRKGVASSTADWILYTDIDWPYTEESMIGLIRKLMEGYDAVIGTRDEQYYAHLPDGRRRISKWLKMVNGKLLRLRVNDTQAGLKGFNTRAKETFLATTIDRYLFDLEFIYLLSARKDVNISSFPIALREGITFSKMNKKILWQEARNFLKVWMRG